MIPLDGEGWTNQAVNWFKDKVSNRTLYARLFPQDIRVSVELFMERGKIGAMRSVSFQQCVFVAFVIYTLTSSPDLDLNVFILK